MLEHQNAEAARKRREDDRVRAYDLAQQREAERQEHIADEARRNREREDELNRAHARILLQKHQQHEQKQANRERTYAQACRRKEDQANLTAEMIRLEMELSEQHRQQHDHNLQKRRDYYRTQNKIRMALAEQHAAATAFREAKQREEWELRKQLLEEQDAEITRMKHQLRQDKERLAMTSTRLKLSQRKGDIKKLDEFLKQLDAAGGNDAIVEGSTSRRRPRSIEAT